MGALCLFVPPPRGPGEPSPRIGVADLGISEISLTCENPCDTLSDLRFSKLPP